MTCKISEIENYCVGLDLSVIPDGVSRKRDSNLSFSLALSPTVKCPTENCIYDLRKWPTEIEDIKGNLKIAVGHVEKNGDDFSINVKTVKFLNPMLVQLENAGATTLWSQIFKPSIEVDDPGLGDGFLALKRVYEKATVSLFGESKIGTITRDAHQSFVNRLASFSTARNLFQSIISLAHAKQTESSRPGQVVNSMPNIGEISSTFWLQLYENLYSISFEQTSGGDGDLAKRFGRSSDDVRSDVYQKLNKLNDSNIGEGPKGRDIFDVCEFSTSEFSVLSSELNKLDDILFTTFKDTEFLQKGSDEFSHWLATSKVREEIATKALFYKAQSKIFTENKDKDAVDNAQHKLAGVLSHPTIANYLNLTINVEISAQEFLGKLEPIDDRHYGAVAVYLGPTNPDITKLSWTAFTALEQQHPVKKIKYFGPCPQNQINKGEILEEELIQDGVINLNISKAGQRRFYLDTLDESHALLNMSIRSQEISKASPRTKVSTLMPPQRQRGIQLIDRFVSNDLFHERQRALFTSNIQFAEDLLLGCRFDAAVVKLDKGGWKNEHLYDPDRWRPLTARKIDYLAEDIPSGFIKGIEEIGLRNHDDGYVQVSVQSPEDNSVIIARPELFAWTGESLALPSNAELVQDGVPEYTVDPEKTMAVGIEYSFPDPADEHRTLPPLREGYGYLFGARACFQNGCGLSFDDVVKDQYIRVDNSVVLGDEPDTECENIPKPFLYKRRQKIEPPSVLLNYDDEVLVKTEMSDDIYGDTIETLVIRSFEKDEYVTRNVTNRFLVPPRISFDFSEQAGLFDTDESNVPVGAFANDYSLALDPENNSFPSAIDGKLRLLRETDKKEKKQQSRGSVLVPYYKAKGTIDNWPSQDVSDAEPFYPDPLGRRLGASFIEASGLIGESLGKELAFWEEPSSGQVQQTADAMPIMLELRPGSTNSKRYYFDAIEQISYRFKQWEFPESPVINLLPIVLAPGEKISVRLWSRPDLDQFKTDLQILYDGISFFGDLKGKEVEKIVKTFSFSNEVEKFILDAIEVLTSSEKIEEKHELLERLLRLTPLPEVQNERIVQLVHAVDKPLKSPVFKSTLKTNKLLFHPVVLNINEKDDWEHYVSKYENEDIFEWKSQPHGTTTFFIGSIQVHRPTTGKVRCVAKWREYTEKSVRSILNGSVKEYRDDPQWQNDTLFSIKDVSSENSFREEPIDLLRKDKLGLLQVVPELRELSLDFPDGRARHLSLQLIATSRFSEYFKKDGDDNSKQFEKRSISKDENWAEVWLPATIRPQQVVIDRVLPLYRWSGEDTSGEAEIKFKRKVSLRIYLKGGWYSSGEGELLGVICWPGNLVSPNAEEESSNADEVSRLKLEDLDPTLDLPSGDEIDPLCKYIYRNVTRIGADPINLSGHLEDIVPADRFQRYHSKANNLHLPIEDNKELEPLNRQIESVTNPKPQPVSVVAYQPEVDIETGEWFCDVTIDPGAAYNPFAQIGVARYQPNSIENMELSVPTTKFVQLAPSREGRVWVVDSAKRQIGIEVHGIGYFQREIGEKFEELRHKGDRSLLNVTLLRSKDKGSDTLLQAFDENGKPIMWKQILPKLKGAENCWCLTDIFIPRSEHSYGLLIEEVEVIPADKYPRKDNIQLQERGPLFSTTIKLDKLL